MLKISTAAIAGAVLALTATVASAEPPLWAIRDADSTIYLFGTVHLLPKDGAWRTPRLEEAFAAADTLWLEVDLGEAAGLGFPAMAKLGTSPQRPLADRLTPADHARLAAAATRLGLPPSALEKLRPWLAAVILSVEAAKKAGYGAVGVDATFAREAALRDLPIRSFETGEQQLRFFADLDEASELGLLVQTLDDLEQGDALLRDMMTAWLTGDTAGLETSVIANLRDAGPTVYDVLLTRRNEAWAVEIERLLAGSGTQFIAVGAGHLLGPDSVQAALARRGITVERVEGEP